ncbi:HAD family hydrolase [Chloroflexota bacterium]
MKYKAVVFDLFGTLINNIPSPINESMLVEMASILTVSGKESIRLWSDTYDQRSTGIFQNAEESIRYICKELGVSPPSTQVELAVRLRNEFIERMITPRPDSLEVLSYLKSASYKSGLITDCSAETVICWEKLPIANLIDVSVFSCSVGLKKPDPRIYHLAVEQLGVYPGDCLYIGDGGSQELTGAAAVGMHSVLIRHHDEDSSGINYEREEWRGTVITSLKEVLELVK